MSDLNPYPADPYRQGSAGSPYPADFDRASQSASGVSSTRNGYYSADDLGDQSPHFPETQGGQMVPYPGGWSAVVRPGLRAALQSAVPLSVSFLWAVSAIWSGRVLGGALRSTST